MDLSAEALGLILREKVKGKDRDIERLRFNSVSSSKRRWHNY